MTLSYIYESGFQMIRYSGLLKDRPGQSTRLPLTYSVQLGGVMTASYVNENDEICEEACVWKAPNNFDALPVQCYSKRIQFNVNSCTLPALSVHFAELNIFSY